MEPMLLRGGTLVELDPPSAEVADLRLEAGKIVERKPNLSPRLGCRTVDLGGRLVLPGLVCGHTHLYSSLARGMPPALQAPRDFPDLLLDVWWRLDRALDREAIYLSALIGALEAVRAGTTTIVDHHASPSFIEGSLDIVADACRAVGVRAVLCYEVTDRGGREERDRGIQENRRFLSRAANDRRAGMIGAHASFTLGDDTLDALSKLRAETGRGIHIHVAEAPCDDADARRRGARSALSRLERAGLLSPAAVLAHGTHLSDEDLAIARERGCWIVQNPRSNMNNSVGYARMDRQFSRAALGTDGISNDMLAEAKVAFLKARDAGLSILPQDVLRLMRGACTLASEQLGVELGTLRPGAAADLVILDYRPPTPVNISNVAAHVLCGIGAEHVTSVIVGGSVVLERRTFPRLDVEKAYADARQAASRLWSRM